MSSQPSPLSERAVALVPQLHKMIDELTAPLHKRHQARLNCARGCHSCCVDELTVFSVEAEHIRRTHAALLESAAPHAEGLCAFLDEQGACRIYEVRPYVCRTQGLPLRWIELEGDDEYVELRDICPLNLEGESLELLHKDDLWAIGPVEAKLQEFERAFVGAAAPLARVSLRSLFG